MIKVNYLKSIRALLNLKQHDITNGKITRNTISHIENQKISLTEKTIQLILDSINQYLNQTNHFIQLDYDDLFIDERFKNKLLAEDLYKKLELFSNMENTNLDILINEINTLISKWDFPIVKMYVYDLLGKYYYEKLDYTTSQYYYNQGISSAYRIGKSDVIGQAILKLMRADIMANSTSTSLELSKQLISRKSELELQTYLGLLFNSALLLEKKGEYHDALVNLYEIEQSLSEENHHQLMDVLLLQAICEKSLYHYDKALELYKKMLVIMSSSIDNGTKANIYSNILALYIKQNNITEIHCTLEIIFDLLSVIDNENTYLPGIYLELAYCYQFLKEYDNAITYFDLSITAAIKLNVYADLAEALSTYIKLNEFLKLPIDRTKTLLILQLMSSRKIQLNDEAFLYYLSYLETNQAYEELNFFVNNMIKIRKEHYNEL
jgi:tetratricopeptide (TPR) repeat protein